MNSAPYHNRDRFVQAVVQLLTKADQEARTDDLARVVSHIEGSPSELSRLGGLMMLLDENWRHDLRDHIDAYRRWRRQKGQSDTDDDVFELMLQTYKSWLQSKDGDRRVTANE